MVVLGVALLLAALYALGRFGQDEDPSVETPTRAETTPTPAAGDGEERGGSEPRRRPRRVRVRITATGPVYVCMEDARGRPVVDKRTLAAGESTPTLRGRRFRVTFGTSNARIRMNGRSYRVATSQEPVGYELRPGRPPRRLSSGLATCT